MSTQVILLERIEKLGKMGDVVQVRPGYARNYLLPQKKALRASKENIAYFESQKAHLEAANEKSRKEAEKRAKKIEGVKVALIRQASESGQLFGSVTARDIAEQLTAQTGEQVLRSMVAINQNYKDIGLFPVSVMLHPEVKVEVTINVARTVEEAEMQEKTGKAMISDDKKQGDRKEMPAEPQLENLLDDAGLQAQKEKEQAEAEAAAEESKSAEERAAKKATKKPKKVKAEEAEDESVAAAEDGDE